MDNKITGAIHQIGQTQTFDSGFTKRLCVITFQDGNYENHLAIDFVKDKCDILDQYQVGQEVTINFNLRSNENPKKEGQWFTNPTAWKIESEGRQQSPQQPAQRQSTGQQAPSQGSAADETDDIPF